MISTEWAKLRIKRINQRNIIDKSRALNNSCVPVDAAKQLVTEYKIEMSRSKRLNAHDMCNMCMGEKKPKSVVCTRLQFMEFHETCDSFSELLTASTNINFQKKRRRKNIFLEFLLKTKTERNSSDMSSSGFYWIPLQPVS